MTKTLKQIQLEHSEWAQRNWPGYAPYRAVLGMMEELGELSHAHLKTIDGIRGTAESHSLKERDALGDLLLFACAFASAQGYDLETILNETWEQVSQRDWIKYPLNGRDA